MCCVPAACGPVWAAGEVQLQWSRGCVWIAGWAQQRWAPRGGLEPSSSLRPSAHRPHRSDTAPSLNAEPRRKPGIMKKRLKSWRVYTVGCTPSHNYSLHFKYPFANLWPTPSLWSFCGPRGESVSMLSSSSAVSAAWLMWRVLSISARASSFTVSHTDNNSWGSWEMSPPNLQRNQLINPFNYKLQD